MRMIDMGRQKGPLHIIDTTTAVDCTRDVATFRRSFRSLLGCMLLSCCGFHPSSSSSDSSSTVTGTFFGHRRGRVSFCLHDGRLLLLLLDFAIPTSYLAREMSHGLLRIALECCHRSLPAGRSSSLFGVPVWAMYCNGRKVGFAVRRQATEADAAVWKVMRSVSVGAGVLPNGGNNSGEGGLMYLRARFERVVGSVDSESFHMINPAGSTGQELSIFLLRS